ncbi:MAG TPA: LuxR C-terminal-related transcriptional regulator [Leptospiraceae bacterium]|nr:LuxR C-terminal-related transcriptional regulator [Leptospiraceae bacterium]HMW07838.1 LuxR C-terminal-related transcriptional regulator [Leptospiraceae bacterium]HMX34814.1 LuxR C-terminal-related transcriptional regulator [Leptospiraceae bacterium]HMY33476.1 LuxR C-terminal-related transcriptional regulator [Leptospiraceae bacterium]HMZ65997.1 LuxR C-terminal-related transcriptional regulator [Leptospiraceae bacterium]
MKNRKLTLKILFQQEKRFYFFALFVFFMTFWILEDILSLYLNAHWLHYSQTYFTFMEAVIAFFSITGIYFLFKELKDNKTDIEKAEKVIESLQSKNQKLNDLNLDFWKSIQDQYNTWGLTQAEKDIATLLLRGLSNQQIAAIRGKSLKTIENQAFSIYQKSGTTGKLEFIAFFISPLLPEED